MEVRECPKCGASVSNDTLKCDHCGVFFNSKPSSVTQVAVANGGGVQIFSGGPVTAYGSVAGRDMYVGIGQKVAPPFVPHEKFFERIKQWRAAARHVVGETNACHGRIDDVVLCACNDQRDAARLITDHMESMARVDKNALLIDAIESVQAYLF